MNSYMEQVLFAKVMYARTMFKSKWRDLSVVHHHLEKELLESSYSALGSGKSEGCLVNKHTHVLSSMHYVQRLSSLHFLHIFAAISYCLMLQWCIEGIP